jgi:hypothetical protein
LFNTNRTKIFMKQFQQAIVVGMAAVCTLAGAGRQNPQPAGAVEIAVSSGTVPAGGTIQVRFGLTQPMPIGSTGTGFALDGFATNGIALWSPNGVAFGVGVMNNGVLTFTAVDPSLLLGTVTDYPFLTLTLTAPAIAKTGATFPFTWSADAWLNSQTGPLNVLAKTGNVTIGGTASIQGVFPGGGTWPAGTVIRIIGSGFQKTSKLQTKVQFSSMSITPTEIDLTLKSETMMDSQAFTVQNPDGSSATFFAYLRGLPQRVPSKALLQNAEFAFPRAAHALATVQASGAASDSQWNALALQNPNPGPAAVTIEVEPHGQGRSALIVIPAGGRVVDTISGLLSGAVVGPTETVTVTSTAMIQMFGISGDDVTGTLKPFLPVF